MTSEFETPLLYARVWEDERVLRRALELGSTDDVLSIASAGDNAFALLLDDVRRVTMIDRNETQLALVHLKMAVLRRMDPRDARRFLGAEPAPPDERKRRYNQIRGDLSERWSVIFDGAANAVEMGLLNVGKFEKYLATFRRRVLPLVQSKKTVRELMELSDLDAQRQLYERRWDTWRWRSLFRLFFGRHVMERIGRERAFFDQVTQRNIGDVFRDRARKALCDLPAADNPYLRWILTGETIAPPYLADETYAVVRERLDRVAFVECDLQTHLREVEPGTYSAFNLSDCFEYLSQDVTNECLRALVQASRPGARLCYWNLLVPRNGDAVEGIYSNESRAAELFATDRAFFYGRLVLESVATDKLSLGS
jgi:S-adenosylmethionine-diacylglycerol 3-amino-3-carboxypropyl transferase